MGEKKSFQEILDEQLMKTKKTSSPAPAEPAPLPPLKFEFDFSFITKHTTMTKAKLEAYPRPAVVKATPPPPPARPKDVTVPVKGFSSVEVAALQTLGLPLDRDLSRNALKAKYRSLVRKLHPDHHAETLSPLQRNRLTERFQAVLEAYRVLAQVFANNESCSKAV